jgi:hypothetical protein
MKVLLLYRYLSSIITDIYKLARLWMIHCGSYLNPIEIPSGLFYDFSRHYPYTGVNAHIV